MKETQTDQQLVEAANAGDAGAMRALYERHRDWVYGMALRMCHRREDALDVMQQVFVEFFERFPGFELTSELRTYLYPSVRHRTIDLLRKRDRREPQGPEQLPEPTVPPDQGRDRLRDHLANLSADHREVILLRFGEDLPLQAIADRLGIPLGTVKSRLHHALAHLRHDLQA